MTGREPPLCVHLLPDTHDAGAENQARYLISGLASARDLDVELVYFGAGRAHPEFEATGVPTLHLPRLRRFRFDAYGRARRLRLAYAHRDVAILHTWLLEANVIGLFAARSWPGTRVVITQRGSWNELDYPGLVRLQKLLIGRADAAISNSSGGAEMLRSIGMPAGEISVIANGIPAERVSVCEEAEAVRRREGWGDRSVIAWIGRVNDPETISHKDVGTLFSGFETLRARRPDAILAMIGASSEELAAVGVAPPPGVEALGWRPRPADVVNAADLVVLSSKREGNSNVVGEALLLGMPVVSTDCGDHTAAVAASGGRVVPVADPAALAQAIDELLASPPPRDAVRNAVAEMLSVDRMVAETSTVYDRLVTPKSAIEPR